MASIYKRRYRRADGSIARMKTYRIEYNDEHGRRRVVAGYKDKVATLAKANELERNAERARSGLKTHDRTKAFQPIQQAVDAFALELQRIGNCQEHCTGQRRYVERCIAWCGWATLASMRRDRFLEFLGHLARKGRAPNTQNNYRHAMMAFVKFCVDQSWLEENVLGTVPKTKVTLKPRQRRALSVEEFQRLTQLPKYGTVYLIAGLSGLRKKELRLLERRDIRPAEWRLRGEITKSKRAETVPMLPECWEILQPIWEQLSPLDKLVPKLPTHRVFDNDLKRADIAKRAEDGRQVDFHSLRYFFCTLCGRKLSIQLVRKLMRHRDIRTTCNLYMDLGIDDVLESIPELPRLFNKNGALQ